MKNYRPISLTEFTWIIHLSYIEFQRPLTIMTVPTCSLFKKKFNQNPLTFTSRNPQKTRLVSFVNDCTPIYFQYNITAGGRTTETTGRFPINRIIITDGINSNNCLIQKWFFINFLKMIEMIFDFFTSKLKLNWRLWEKKWTNSPGLKYQIIFITSIIKSCKFHFFLNFHSLR